MSVGSLTTAAVWRNTTAFVLISRWNLTSARGQLGSNSGRRRSGHRETFRRAITTQRAGNWWNPQVPPLTVLTAMGRRVHHVSQRKGCHWHSSHGGLRSTQTLYLFSLFLSGVPMLLIACTWHEFVTTTCCFTFVGFMCFAFIYVKLKLIHNITLNKAILLKNSCEKR